MSYIKKVPGSIPSKSGIIRVKGTQQIDYRVIDEINRELHEKSNRQRANDLIAYANADQIIAGSTHEELGRTYTLKK